MRQGVDLSIYDNTDYRKQLAARAGLFKRGSWYLINAFVFKSYLFPFSGLKTGLLRLFGASIGKGVNIKPGVSIKYPWYLEVGNYCWIGEASWIDNLAPVVIGDHVCLSQGSLLLCGNHNFKRRDFALEARGIRLEDGVWIGANAVVCPGVTCKTHAVLSVGSIATNDLEAFGIYQGNPATFVRKREFIEL